MNYRCHNVAPELSPIHLKWNPMCWLLGDKALPFSWEWAGLSRIPLLHNSGSRQLALCTAALGSTERRPTQWPRGYRAMFPPWIQIGLAAGEASVADNGLTTSSTNRYDLKVLTGMWNALPSACVPLRELEATWKINPFRIIGVRPNCRCRGAPEILWSIITDSPPPPPPKKTCLQNTQNKGEVCQPDRRWAEAAEQLWVISYHPSDAEVNEPGTIWTLSVVKPSPSPVETSACRWYFFACCFLWVFCTQSSLTTHSL